MENIKISRIIRTGTSLCVVIPKNILAALDLRRGDNIVFGIADKDTLVLRKLSDADIQKLKLTEF